VSLITSLLTTGTPKGPQEVDSVDVKSGGNPGNLTQ